MLDKRFDATLVLELVALAVAFVRQYDSDAGIQKRQLSETLREYVVMELDVIENRLAGPETQTGPGFFSLTNHRQRRHRLSVTIFLLMFRPVTVNRQAHLVRERIHDRHADAMKPA